MPRPARPAAPDAERERLAERVRELEAALARERAGAEEARRAAAEREAADRRRDELLRRSERMASLGHTLAGVAHELNNPLAAIRGFAQLLLKGEWPEEERSALETIVHEAGRAARIVKDLLLFARRQESGARERVDLNRVVRYVAETQRYPMETGGIRCELELADGLPAVLADPAQLEQVVLNLVANARQALEGQLDRPAVPPRGSGRPSAPGWGPGGGAPPRVRVRTAARGGQVTLEVMDNGPGIAPEHRARIWDPFWTTKGEHEGTGLGLSVVQAIVTEHGGMAELDTEAGAGTCLRIVLPAAPAPEPSAEPPGDAPAAAGQAARPRDILVVEGDPASLGFLARYFTSRGHAVVAAGDATQALRLAAQSPFEVVVCARRLPGTDGLALVQALRALPTCAQTRFVLATAERGAGVRRRAAALGVAAVLQRPYEIEALRQAVEE